MKVLWGQNGLVPPHEIQNTCVYSVWWSQCWDSDRGVQSSMAVEFPWAITSLTVVVIIHFTVLLQH